ncbi:MAG: hypothetical protein NT011_07495 [Kiritimatiellaeota bacterium]|nr:hypothetical protein [Kiritimatiellota bacterium]
MRISNEVVSPRAPLYPIINHYPCHRPPTLSAVMAGKPQRQAEKIWLMVALSHK